MTVKMMRKVLRELPPQAIMTAAVRNKRHAFELAVPVYPPPKAHSLTRRRRFRRESRPRDTTTRLFAALTTW